MPRYPWSALSPLDPQGDSDRRCLSQLSHSCKETMNPTQAVLFDLDGTLLDTAADLGTALNTLMQEEGHSPLPLSTIRPAAGSGCRGLLQLGLQMDASHPRYPTFCERLLDLYEKNMLR